MPWTTVDADVQLQDSASTASQTCQPINPHVCNPATTVLHNSLDADHFAAEKDSIDLDHALRLRPQFRNGTLNPCLDSLRWNLTASLLWIPGVPSGFGPIGTPGKLSCTDARFNIQPMA